MIVIEKSGVRTSLTWDERGFVLTRLSKHDNISARLSYEEVLDNLIEYAIDNLSEQETSDEQ